MADPIQESLAALSMYLVGDTTMGETLQRVCEATLTALPAARYVGISLAPQARLGDYVVTDPVLNVIDDAQYRTADGPCVEAFITGEIVIVRSTFEDGPYPEFRAAARRHGILSVVSLPMKAATETIGVLNLHAEAEYAFKAADLDDAVRLASQAAFVLANVRAYRDARSLSENLTQAMQSRAVIEQAKGIIIGVMGVSADEAFEQLRQQSQHENVKVREIAAEIVRRAQRSRPADGPGSRLLDPGPHG